MPESDYTWNQLEWEIQNKEAELRGMKAALENLRRRCQHKWGKTEYTPDYQPGYRIEGDPPGTMGVDWRGPMWVDSKTTPKWTRKCSECGLKQVTERTSDKVEKIPVF
jgi:hypothetical protein